MATRGGQIVLYAKTANFEYDPEDGTCHTVLVGSGMEVRIIQTRHHFLRTGANADKFRRSLDTAEVVEFPPKE